MLGRPSPLPNPIGRGPLAPLITFSIIFLEIGFKMLVKDCDILVGPIITKSIFWFKEGILEAGFN